MSNWYKRKKEKPKSPPSTGLLGSKHGDIAEIEGVFVTQTYINDDGFVIGSFEDADTLQRFTAKGTITPFRLNQPMIIKGIWEQSKWGLQLKIRSYETMSPTSIRGIKGFLGSGIVPGIGPHKANIIVDYFGHKTLEILEHTPERLIEVPGLGNKIVTAVQKNFKGGTEEQTAMTYLMGLGISAKRAASTWKKFGEQTVQKIKENPYKLLEVYGIGFLIADAAAIEAGWAKDEPRRLLEGAKYFIWKECNQGGHAFIEEDLAIKIICDGLKVDKKAALAGIASMVKTRQGVFEDGAIYPRFLYDAEKEIAEAVLAIEKSRPRNFESFQNTLAKEEKKLNILLNKKQKLAVWNSVISPFSVLTGGPGTGKTTTLRAIIAMNEIYGERIILGSPTGRAAKRMTEVTGKPAFTVHRMLGLRVPEEKTETHRLSISPIAEFNDATLVILDEATMKGLTMMYYITEALGDKRVLLVGDVNQLPSVEPGLVLKDLIDSGITDTVVLDEVFRQALDSGIVMNSNKINSGLMPNFDSYDDFKFVPSSLDDINRNINRTILALEKRGFNPYKDVQFLSPMKKGPAGTEVLNIYLQNKLNPPNTQHKELSIGNVVFREKDKVMQTKNDYDLEVFNGDQGYIVSVDPTTRSLVVDFGSETAPRLVEYTTKDINEGLIHSWVTTVHKSQGGEWPVVVIICVVSHYNMLQRNLLYTGVTRAREMLVLVGEKRAIGIACKNNKPAHRNTRLKQRILIKKEQKSNKK